MKNNTGDMLHHGFLILSNFVVLCAIAFSCNDEIIKQLLYFIVPISVPIQPTTSLNIWSFVPYLNVLNLYQSHTQYLVHIANFSTDSRFIVLPIIQFHRPVCNSLYPSVKLIHHRCSLGMSRNSGGHSVHFHGYHIGTYIDRALPT